MAYDLLIKNGRIVDGTGRPSFQGSVAVEDGRIVEVGKVSGPAKRTIDAQGLVVSPGFIDNHCHYDAQVTWDPLCTFSCYHGATTVVFGNCSLTLAPAKEGDHYALAQMLSRVEAIPMEVLQAGVDWSWRTVPEYLNAIERRLGVNAGVLMGHSAIRRYVMGEASQERGATEDEVRQMQGIVREGLEAGALGLSVSRNQGHFDTTGRLLPAILAPVDEMMALASSMKDIGTGIVQCGGGTTPEMKEGLCSRLSRVSGRPVVYNNITHRWSAPNQWREHLDYVEKTVKEGNRAYPLLSPRRNVNRFTMLNSQVFDRLPTWKPIMEGSPEQKKAAFRDKEMRKKLRWEAVEGAEVPYNAFSRRWDYFFVAQPSLAKNQSLKGKSIDQIAREQGKDVLDAFLDLVLEEDLKTGFELVQGGGDEEAMAEMLRNPNVIIGLSDGGAHVVFEAGYGYSTYFLGHWVREKGVMGLEEGVRKLTSVPAELFGMEDRGALKPGLNADITIFDPNTIAPLEAEEVQDFPAGGRRLRQLSEGVYCTIVNGEVLIREGKHTGALPGRVARNGRWRSKRG
jgi:N-acyl-D-aspartate/D-glutamate deacylase